MRAPQIIMISIMAMNIGITLVKDGTPREDKYSLPISLVSTAINVALLKWGGFF